MNTVRPHTLTGLLARFIHDGVSTAVQKSWQEKRRLRREKEGQRRLKASRKKEQAANVARKEREKKEHKSRCLAGMGGGQEDQGEEGSTAEEDQGEEGSGAEEEEEEEDREWFRREVGEEPDEGTERIIMCIFTMSPGSAAYRSFYRQSKFCSQRSVCC